ncbi:MAG: S8 family serine peptidase [Candidatus Solibacter sp.]|nr:S8 family serine peptidase [Candidatus Solibacter sp.]
MKTTFFLLLSASAMFAQVVPGRYILELSGDPAAVAAVQQGARPGASVAATAMAARRGAVRQSQASARTAVAERGGTVVESLDTVFNGLIVNIPDERAAELLQVPGAVKLHAVRRVRPLLSHALPLHKVPEAWNLLPLGQNGAGAGIKIGMIDSGIDVNNPAFSDPLPPVDGFPKVLYASDIRFTNAKVIVAKNYTKLLPDGGDPDANDRDGHGTGTSVVAAGGATNTPYGPLTGVAPKAYIANYKVLDANGGTSDVIAKAIDDAVADGMDVLNISLGSYVTSYSDIASSEVGQAAIARATAAGVIVVVAAGNTGPGAGTIGDYASAPDAITMGAIHNDRSLGNAVTIDGVAPYAAFPGDGPDPGQVIAGTLFDVTQMDVRAP